MSQVLRLKLLVRPDLLFYQTSKIIHFFPVRSEFKLSAPELRVVLNEFGDAESEYSEEYIAADYHYDDGNEDTEHPPPDTDLTEEEYQRDAALTNKKIENEKEFKQWRTSHIFESSGAVQGFKNYLQYFAIALVKKVI